MDTKESVCTEHNKILSIKLSELEAFVASFCENMPLVSKLCSELDIVQTKFVDLTVLVIKHKLDNTKDSKRGNSEPRVHPGTIAQSIRDVAGYYRTIHALEALHLSSRFSTLN